MTPVIRVERAYDVAGSAPSPSGPALILVDRLWPRGIRKLDLEGVGWMQSIAPSKQLRRWYGHEARRWEEFGKRYRAELAQPEQADDLAQLRALLSSRGLVLVTATKDVERSGAQVLAELLRG